MMDVLKKKMSDFGADNFINKVASGHRNTVIQDEEEQSASEQFEDDEESS